jgi:hypothetical protein
MQAVPATHAPATVQFCELPWDFSAFQQLVGRENAYFESWRIWYKRTNSVQVLTSEQVTTAANEMFRTTRDFDYTTIFPSVAGASRARSAEGFNRPVRADKSSR